tara:strand:- start:6355 stop:7302 length:948 start_codon:yes stop_codon:yes gene_type:complete
MNDNENFLDKDRVEQINLHEILNVFLSNKLLIFLITTLCACASVFYSLSQQDIYQSSAVLMANEGSSAKSDNLSGLSSMASLAGLNIQSSGGVSKASLAVEIIKSRDFFKHISSIDSVFANLTSIKSYNPELKKVYFDEKIYNQSLNEWQVGQDGTNLKPNLQKAYENYLFSVSVMHEKKSGFLYLSFQHQSPVFAKYFMDLIIQEVNIIMKNKDLAQSSKAIEYLYSQLKNDSYVVINKSISRMIESNMYTKMMASIETEYFISVLDSPYEPEFKIAPVRWLICILGTMSGFIFSLLLCLILNYYPLLFKNNKV